MVIDERGTVVAETRLPLPPSRGEGGGCEQDPQAWSNALGGLFAGIACQLPLDTLQAIAIDATSGTVLLTDRHHQPLSPALMYNDTRATRQGVQIAAAAPATLSDKPSGLARLLWLRERQPLARWFHCQGSWLNQQLLGPHRTPHCDSNSALKLGYDPHQNGWPAWLAALGMASDQLPEVVPAGTPLGAIGGPIARRYGLSPTTQLVAGTTDSTAALLASGITDNGDAVTSLGSTLVVKVISPVAISSNEHGVYSQPFGDRWLVGGASNSGGAVLRHYFSDAEMAAMTPQLQPDHPTGLDYYPLLGCGERFPINDPQWMPRLTPRPGDPRRFFQAILEGIAGIERDGYRRLERLGAPYPRQVVSVGGGAANAPWRAIRSQRLGCPVTQAAQREAAYGTAQLARRGWQSMAP